MINIANVQRVDRLVDAAIVAGAKVVVRGGPIQDGPLAKGAFYRPTLLEIRDHSLRIARLVGIELVHGRRPTAADRAADRGGHGLSNNWTIVYDETEEGGYKQSGGGRLNGVSRSTTSSNTGPSSTKLTWLRTGTGQGASS
jgi:betaine-aldehyde dehydrogenase